MRQLQGAGIAWRQDVSYLAQSLAAFPTGLSPFPHCWAFSAHLPSIKSSCIYPDTHCFLKQESRSLLKVYKMHPH